MNKIAVHLGMSSWLIIVNCILFLFDNFFLILFFFFLNGFPFLLKVTFVPHRQFSLEPIKHTSHLCSHFSTLILMLLLLLPGPLPLALHPLPSMLEDPMQIAVHWMSFWSLFILGIPLHFVSVLKRSPNNQDPGQRTTSNPDIPCSSTHFATS